MSKQSCVTHGATGGLSASEAGTGARAAFRARLPLQEHSLSCALPVHWGQGQRLLQAQHVYRWQDKEYEDRVGRLGRDEDGGNAMGVALLVYGRPSHRSNTGGQTR